MFKGVLLTAAMVVFAGQAEPLRDVDQSELEFDGGEVLDEMASIVTAHFFDREFDVKRWKSRVENHRKRAIASKTRDEFSVVMNELLGTLKTSHTRYFSKLDPKRYQLLGVFHQVYEDQGEDLFIYAGIGIDTRTVNGKPMVSAVFDGMPAAKAGLAFGDEILAVDGAPFHPIESFAGKVGEEVSLQIKRAGIEKTLSVLVENLDGRSMFERALDASIKVIERNGSQIGYIHVWSYAGTKYQEQIRAAILWGKLRHCDSLVLDLRDGWGGADVNYLNLFRPPIVDVDSWARDGTAYNYTGVWGKPVVLLTNAGSTSGKELFTFGFKKLKLGKVFGETTAGAVVGGRSFLLSNGDLLYLAVTDVTVDGTRIEGVGVAPDVHVERPIHRVPTVADPQLERALQFLTQKK